MGLFRARQRHWNGASVLQKDIHPFPAIARAKRVRRHRDRIGHVQEDCRSAGRPDLGRVATHEGVHLLLRSACGGWQMMESNRTNAQPLEVLLVEDSPGDVRLTKEALKDAKVHINLRVVRDGIDAMAFLMREGEYATAPRPDLILLDLNLPRKDGREVLREIKENQELKSIPVVILTTSASEADILRSYLLHANCYITQLVNHDGFLPSVRSIDSFWLSVVKLPPNPGQ